MATAANSATDVNNYQTPALSKNPPDIYVRINRVVERFALSFAFRIAFEKEAQGGLGLNLFKFVTIYPELVLHLVPRKEYLEGSFAIKAERLANETDKVGNTAFVATLAAGVASYALKFFAAQAASQALLSVTGVFFALTLAFKVTAFASTLTADFCNQKPASN